MKILLSLLSLLVPFAPNAAQAAIAVTGEQVPMDSTQAYLVQKDCAVLKTIPSVEKTNQDLAAQSALAARLMNQSPLPMAALMKVQETINHLLVQLDNSQPASLTEAKWKVSYTWKFPATKLVDDGMAFPYALLAAKGTQFGVPSNDFDLKNFKLESSHENELYFIGITLTTLASSYQLCTRPHSINISAKLDWNNAAGPAPYADLQLSTLEASK